MTEYTQTNTQEANPLVDGSVCLLINFDRLGVRRRLRDDQYVAGDAEKALTKANKCVLDSPELKSIASFEGHVKHYLASKALPSKLYRTSTYLIPVKAIGVVDEFVANARVEWLELVEAFVAAYPARKAETMKRLGSVAEEGDYKTEAEVRAEFGFEFEYVTMSTPTTLKQISAAMFEREEARLRDRLSLAETEIVAAFRGKFAGAVEDMKDILTGGEKDGKPRRFHGWKIPKLQQYIKDFKAESNVCGDSELVSLMDECGKLLDGVDPKALKNDQTWRDSIATSFGEIGVKLEAMTTIRGKRMIDLEDEDEDTAAVA